MRFLPILMLALLADAADPREAQVAAASTSFGKCWNTRDTECLSKLVTDDFVQITRTARLVDKAGFLEGMKSGNYSQGDPNAPAPQRRDVKVRFYGDTAIVTFVQASRGPVPRGSQLQGQIVDHYETLVWVTVDSKNWRLASMHVSLPSAPPPQ